ncbi:hypothetical protein J2X69_000628 [Algoriphagus sp. 4150]|uniref:hypothetical protein n=1 Tax=Algoriphagus sp. 4150 TaxID=2817756 RepID=UPI00285E1697|nr:hypothetical protein [Algoriphagus sp. 4150]MDR7128300.1 hypothetical protein [Algoriphagus sp. 4150]
MKYYLSFPLLLFLFLQGCQEENTLNPVEFYWDQTGCSDPWKTGSNDSNEEILQAVQHYLKEEGVKNAKVISITDNGIRQFCKACFCTTGARINLIAPANQKSKMIALGFQESN